MNQQPTHEIHPAIRALINEKAKAHGWHDAAEYAMHYLANTHQPFTADDLRDLLDGNEPQTPNAIGGLFMSWSSQGLIQRHGIAQSRNPRSNSSIVFTWIGTPPAEEQAA